jgi:hypothetical protein
MDDKLARWVEMKRWNNACFFAMVVMFYAFKRHPPSILVVSSMGLCNQFFG